MDQSKALIEQLLLVTLCMHIDKCLPFREHAFVSRIDHCRCSIMLGIRVLIKEIMLDITGHTVPALAL